MTPLIKYTTKPTLYEEQNQTDVTSYIDARTIYRIAGNDDGSCSIFYKVPESNKTDVLYAKEPSDIIYERIEYALGEAVVIDKKPNELKPDELKKMMKKYPEFFV